MKIINLKNSLSGQLKVWSDMKKEKSDITTLLSATLEVLTSQNVRTDLVLIRHLTI